MAITSESKPKRLTGLRSTQLQYAIVYIVLTFIALLFLNIYSSKVSQEIFFNSKEASMIEKCKLAAVNIAELDALSGKTIAEAIPSYKDWNVNRLLVTDQNCKIIFDTNESLTIAQTYALLPEVLTALEGNDVFYWRYHNSAMQSNAATPIYSYGTLIGCVYMMEYDRAQGSLIYTLQNRIFAITIILAIFVIAFSLLFSQAYSNRLRKIMNSIRIVRKGDYSHKLSIGGHDELNALGSEFNDLVSRLQTSENKRSQFVSDASHELKTPLASIKLLSDSILQNNMDVDTIKEFVGDIGKEADRLNRMSQKLLALSRTEAQSPSEADIIYIAPTIQRIVRMLSANALSNHIQVICNLEEDCTILIPEDDLSQIIFNLLENGIKYNRDGGTLEISLKKESDNVVIQITDTGIGIPEESLSHIFERFYRVDKARSRSTGGSGLGLSIVRNMVERNGGKISVNSTVGVGSTFILTFPIFDVLE